MSTLCMSLLSSDLSSAALGFRKRLNQVRLPAVGVKVSLQACASNRCFLHPQPLPHIWTQCKRYMEVIICRAETRHLHRIWSHEVLYFFCVVKRTTVNKIGLNDSFLNWTDPIIEFGSLIQRSSRLNQEHQGSLFFAINKMNLCKHTAMRKYESVYHVCMYLCLCARTAQKCLQQTEPHSLMYR